MRSLEEQRRFFVSGATLPLEVRLRWLKALGREIRARQEEIAAALRADLGKSQAESYMTETGQCLAELREAVRQLPRWAAATRVPTPFAALPGKSRILREPLGVCLVIAPWNYPLLLAITPVISAIAAGNCVTLKPSEYAPATAKLIRKLCAACLPEEVCRVVTGDAAVAAALTRERFDLIFFTGGAAIGRKVMAAAAEHLTPVVLELGGKSPCIVDETADLHTAGRRIAWGKLLCAGQTCVAPDFLLVHRSVADRLVREIEDAADRFYGPDMLANAEYPRIVNRRHFDRLAAMIPAGDRILSGGRTDARRCKIELTLIDADLSDRSPLMQEEIFGPLLPVVRYDDLDQALACIRRRPKPLALYLFTRSAGRVQQVERTVSFGGGCVNDCVLHLSSTRLPFGGVGESGIGAYHGRTGFETFSHKKSLLLRPARLDPPFRYPPFAGKLPLFQLFLR